MTRPTLTECKPPRATLKFAWVSFCYMNWWIQKAIRQYKAPRVGMFFSHGVELPLDPKIVHGNPLPCLLRSMPCSFRHHDNLKIAVSSIAVLAQTLPFLFRPNMVLVKYRGLVDVQIVPAKGSHWFFAAVSVISILANLSYAFAVAVILMYWKQHKITSADSYGIIPSNDDNSFAPVIRTLMWINYIPWLMMFSTASDQSNTVAKLRQALLEKTPICTDSFRNKLSLSMASLFYMNYVCTILNVAGSKRGLASMIIPVMSLVIGYILPPMFFDVAGMGFLGSYFVFCMKDDPDTFADKVKMLLVDIATNWILFLIVPAALALLVCSLAGMIVCGLLYVLLYVLLVCICGVNPQTPAEENGTGMQELPQEPITNPVAESGVPA